MLPRSCLNRGAHLLLMQFLLLTFLMTNSSFWWVTMTSQWSFVPLLPKLEWFSTSITQRLMIQGCINCAWVRVYFLFYNFYWLLGSASPMVQNVLLQQGLMGNRVDWYGAPNHSGGMGDMLQTNYWSFLPAACRWYDSTRFSMYLSSFLVSCINWLYLGYWWYLHGTWPVWPNKCWRCPWRISQQPHWCRHRPHQVLGFMFGQARHQGNSPRTLGPNGLRFPDCSWYTCSGSYLALLIFFLFFQQRQLMLNGCFHMAVLKFQASS